MTKATHIGHCQICGSRQKLPNGRLAKHGYTTRFGWFEGTCPGSGYLPYEISCDQIEANIVRAKSRLAACRARRADILTADYSNATKAWVHAYRASTWESKGGYFWTETEVTFDENFYGYSYIYEGKPSRGHSLYGLEDRTRHGAFLALQTNFVKSTINKEVAQIKDWIAYATDRVQNWKPAELTEVK